MVKFSDWFRTLTFSTKIILTILPFLFFAILISLVVTVTSQDKKLPVVPVETIAPTVKPTEIPIPLTPEEAVAESSGNTLFAFPYGEESLTSLVNTATAGGLAQCKIIENETIEEKTVRLAPYFKNPVDVASLDTLLNNTILYRQCEAPTIEITQGIQNNIPIVSVSAKFISYYIDTNQKDKAPADRDILRKYVSYSYKIELQADNTWKIIGI